MLVVADQVHGRISRQGGLAGTGQAEEQGGVAILTHIGRAVHWHDIFFGQQEILHGEHGFLHFAGIAHAGEQHLALGKVDNDHTVGIGTVPFRLAHEAGHVENAPLLLAAGVVALGANEHVAAEQVLPGGLGRHPDRDIVIRVGADVQVGYEAVTVGKVGFNPVP